MVQPIQYQVPVADPFAGLLQGLKLGATVQDLQASQQQRMLQQEQMRQQMMQRQQAMEQQQRAQAAMSQFFAKPFEQRSLGDYESLVQFLPKESFAALQNFAKQRTEEQNANEARLYSQMGVAVRSGAPGTAVQLARQRAEAEANPQQKQAFTALANAIEKTPDAAFDMIVTQMMGLGGTYSDAAKKIFDVAAPAEAFKVLTPAEAKARGLPTDRGQIWQLNTKTNQTTVLQAGEKPTELPSDIRILDAVGLPRTPENLMALKGAGATKVTVGGEAKPTRFQDKVDEKAANVYTEWTLEGGSSNAAARIAQLTDVTKTLDKFPELTGPAIGAVPEWAQALIIPRTKALRQNAERIIQEGLRPILGAQFTQAEGENFLKRAFDPSLGAAENARRLKLITQQMKVAAEQKNKFTKYIEQNGTLIGFKGKIPTISDFDAALGIQPAAEQQPAAPAPVPAPAAQSFPVAPQPQVNTQNVDALIDKWRSKYGVTR